MLPFPKKQPSLSLSHWEEKWVFKGATKKSVATFTPFCGVMVVFFSLMAPGKKQKKKTNIGRFKDTSVDKLEG